VWFLGYGFLALERARATVTTLVDADTADSPFADRHAVPPQTVFIAD
jgi:hypothetical protein